MSKDGTCSAAIMLRIRPADKDAIFAGACAAGLTVSKFVIRAALKAAHGRGRRKNGK